MGDTELYTSILEPLDFSPKLGDPYLIKFENYYSKIATCKLFGYNKPNDLPNYGNPEGIHISNMHGSIERFAKQFAVNNFKIGKMRIWGNGDYLLETTLSKNVIDDHGKHYTIPINLIDHYDMKQGSPFVVEIKKEINIVENVWIEFNVNPLARIVFAIYPIKDK